MFGWALVRAISEFMNSAIVQCWSIVLMKNLRVPVLLNLLLLLLDILDQLAT